MKLPQRHNRRRLIPGHSFRQKPAILHDGFAVVGSSKAQIQFAWTLFGTIRPAPTAQPRAESMPEPLAHRRPVAPAPGSEADSTPFLENRGTGAGKAKFLLGRCILTIFSQPAW